MQPVPEDATDEDLYRWFIGALASFGSAKEIEPGLIRVDMSDDDDASAEETQEGVDQINHVLVYITREELRSVSWTEFNVFDDTVPEVLRSQ